METKMLLIFVSKLSKCAEIWSARYPIQQLPANTKTQTTNKINYTKKAIRQQNKQSHKYTIKLLKINNFPQFKAIKINSPTYLRPQSSNSKFKKSKQEKDHWRNKKYKLSRNKK